MTEFNGTPHNSAKKGEIAECVLMPGDPLRAKLIADNYLEDAVCFNTVRNVLGYTGTYKGHRVSVMASGMGIPSMGIYSYELFNFYDVKRIIRIGSAGAMADSLKLGDVVVAANVCTDSNYIAQYNLPGTYTPTAYFPLLEKSLEVLRERNASFAVGTVYTSDVFYTEDMSAQEAFKKMGVLCVEMETVALYCNAIRAGKEALAMFTISDIPATGEGMLTDVRRTSFTEMIESALEIAIR